MYSYIVYLYSLLCLSKILSSYLHFCSSIQVEYFTTLQARFVVATLDGTVQLPSTEEMMEVVRKEMEASAAAGKAPNHFHVFAKEQWAYLDMLAERGAFKPLLPVVESLFEHVCPERGNNLVGYRAQSFKIIDDKTFAVI